MMKGGIAVHLIEPPDAWCRLCLDLEEKIRSRGAAAGVRFIQETPDVTESEN